MAGAGALSACRGDAAATLLGKDMPRMRSVTLDGAGIDLSQLGRPAIIRFWGLWCPPCVRDEPHWEEALRLMATHEDLDDVAIWSVHVGEAPKAGPSLEEWAEARDKIAAVPVVDDRMNALFNAVGIPGTPSTLLVEASGRIADHSWAFKHARGARAFVAKARHVLGRG